MSFSFACFLGLFLRLAVILLMIKILHYLKDPKLWELWYIFLILGYAGFISSTVGGPLAL